MLLEFNIGIAKSFQPRSIYLLSSLFWVSSHPKLCACTAVSCANARSVFEDVQEYALDLTGYCGLANVIAS